MGRGVSISSFRSGVARAGIGALEVSDGALECMDTRGYSLYASWIPDSDNLVVLLYSSDSYSYIDQKDHKKTNIHIYKKVRI